MKLDMLEEEAKKYGSDVHLALYGLNEDKANEIGQKYQQFYDDGKISEEKKPENSFMSSFCLNAPYYLEDALENMHHDFETAVEYEYFSRISREDALVMLNNLAIVPMASISIAYGMGYYVASFMRAWNKANKGQKPISINPDFLP